MGCQPSCSGSVGVPMAKYQSIRNSRMSHTIIQGFIEAEEVTRKKEKGEAAAVNEGPVDCLRKISAATL